jgi:hypothetical protein
MNKTKLFLLAMLLVFVFTTITVYGDNITKNIQVTFRNIAIFANGKQIPSELEPFIYKGHTFIPLRTLGDAFNKKVEWDNNMNKVIITDQVNQNTIVRMDSFYSLMNYLPDNYKIEKTDDKLTIDEIKTMGGMTEKYLNNFYGKFLYNYENVSQKNYRLKSSNEDVLLSSIYYKFENSNIPYPIFKCLKYKDGKLFFIIYISGGASVCGCSDGWITEKNGHFGDNEEIEQFYIFYITKINNSIVQDKQNRTKEITLLNSILLNSTYLDILIK